ncbi:MAG: L-threonine 3-dehydrogenase [Candidatus Cloacimonetes bacterium]|nr:L-threonine 3-dehydrogenase [Candidatus Cloacimonadota bacterium]
MKRILVTGSVGQIGSELTLELRKRYGNDNVVAGVNRTQPTGLLKDSGPWELANCTDFEQLKSVVKKYEIDTIYHLAAILSGVAEAKPDLAWNVNINGLYNVLEIAREFNCKVFIPSSIGAFGPSTPPDKTPQDTIQRPTTMYGVTKVSGELICDYYYKRFGVDTRGVRYPGIISNDTLPGGGTTDYAVEIYYEAIRNKKFTCNLKAGTFMDMMYMPDAINAAIQLMEADSDKLIHRNAFNVTAMSFDPEIIAASIKKVIPEFTMDYNVDEVKQGIADSWPNSLDDSTAKEEWGWNPEYDLEAMTKDMLSVLEKKINV